MSCSRSADRGIQKKEDRPNWGLILGALSNIPRKVVQLRRRLPAPGRRGPCPVSERLAKQKFSPWGCPVNPNEAECFLLKRLLQLKQNNAKQFQDKSKTMFCFRRSYMWNKTLKQFQNVLELFWSCFRVVSGSLTYLCTCRKICKSKNSFRGLSQSPTTTHALHYTKHWLITLTHRNGCLFVQRKLQSRSIDGTPIV